MKITNMEKYNCYSIVIGGLYGTFDEYFVDAKHEHITLRRNNTQLGMIFRETNPDLYDSFIARMDELEQEFAA